MPSQVSRRTFLKTSTGLFVLPIGGIAQARSLPAPRCNEGLALGDVSTEGIVLWSRTDQHAQLHAEWSRYEDFRYTHKCPVVDANESADFTAKLAIQGLPDDEDVFVRTYFRSLKTGKKSRQVEGHLRTPSQDGVRPITFAWSGDIGGQGFGINPKIGGYRIFDAIARTNPDLFFNCGDVVYADAPMRPKRKLSNGKVWHNIVTPAKERVAQSLEGFRGNFRYNYLDKHFRDFSSLCPQIYIWDDHETKNNWYPNGRIRDARYSEKKANLLSAWARQSFFEYLPVAQKPSSPNRLYRKLSQGSLVDVFVVDTRSYRGPNTKGQQKRASSKTALLGHQQLSWLQHELARSTAVWKLIICPQPIGLNVFHHRGTFDGMGNGNNGKPKGRELEVASLLSSLKESKTRNVVWLTADVHYAAAHHYHPKRAKFRDFEPFWEFVAGPLNAGTFGPNPMDKTFGGKVVYQSVNRGMKQSLSPLEGLQFFGWGEVNPETKVLTIKFFNQLGDELWTKDIEAVS